MEETSLWLFPSRYYSTGQAHYCRFKKSACSQLVLCDAQMIPSNLADGMDFASYWHSMAQHIAHKLPSARFKNFQNMLLEAACSYRASIIAVVAYVGTVPT